MQWLRQFIAKNPAKVFREGPEPITMGIRNMKRKVKFFDKLYDTDTLDEEINAWIEGYNKELIDVRLTADWYEEHKYNLNSEIYYLIRYWGDEERNSDFYKWFDDTKNEAIKTLVNMHQFGYEVEKEPRYTVRIKGIGGYSKYLNRDTNTQRWLFASKTELERFRAHHTRKELESNGFEWVFNCEGVEVTEVTDE